MMHSARIETPDGEDNSEPSIAILIRPDRLPPHSNLAVDITLLVGRKNRYVDGRKANCSEVRLMESDEDMKRRTLATVQDRLKADDITLNTAYALGTTAPTSQDQPGTCRLV